jgi:type IV secretion system protein VirB8
MGSATNAASIPRRYKEGRMTDHQSYFTAARSWADQQAHDVERKARVAWIVAGVTSAIALLLAIAVIIMTPLKSVEPYIVLVDRQTGAVDVDGGVAAGPLTQNEAVIQAQLAGYVRARETFDSTDLPMLYRRVQLLSSPAVARAYVQSMAADNPVSPLRTLNQGDMLKVIIKSTSTLGRGVALVRFDVQRSVASGQTAERRSYVAAISYGFSGKPLRQDDRFENPLGFQVTRYRRDSEGAS